MGGISAYFVPQFFNGFKTENCNTTMRTGVEICSVILAVHVAENSATNNIRKIFLKMIILFIFS